MDAGGQRQIDPPELPTGSATFGGTDRFVVQRRLGAGGMGVVYEAYDTEGKASIALKSLPDIDPAKLYLFKQEFRSLCRVSHPNLITLHELFFDDDRWYFTMELVDGIGFLGYVRSEVEKSEAETRTLADAAVPDGTASGVATIRDSAPRFGSSPRVSRRCMPRTSCIAISSHRT